MRELKLIRKFILTGAAGALFSCSSLIPAATPKDVYILGASQEKFCDSTASKSIISGVSEGGSVDFANTQRIVFRNASKLGNYQFAEWSEPVNQRVLRLVTERLRCEGFQIEALDDSTNDESTTLEIEVLDFSHEATIEPGNFRAIVRVIKTSGAQKVEKLFNIEKEIKNYNVEGAVAAADQTIEELLRGVVDFLN